MSERGGHWVEAVVPLSAARASSRSSSEFGNCLAGCAHTDADILSAAITAMEWGGSGVMWGEVCEIEDETMWPMGI